jgi:hypothetical protein
MVDDVLKKKSFFYFLSTNANAGIQTLNHRIMSQVFYYCATRAQSKPEMIRRLHHSPGA